MKTSRNGSEPRPLDERIKAHIENSKVSLEELARAAGWSQQKTHRKIHGKTRWLAEDMETLARVLGKSVATLYREKAS